MLEHLANGVRMQPEHPGRFTNTHSFDVAGSANPAIQLHRVDPTHLLSEHCSMHSSELQRSHIFASLRAVFTTTLQGHYLSAVYRLSALTL